MGTSRRKGERRLVDPVSKMTDASMADFIQTENFENTPFHLGYIIRNCLALTYPVEEKMGNCVSRRKGLFNIFELNTSLLRRGEIYPGKRGGCSSFCTGKKQNST